MPSTQKKHDIIKGGVTDSGERQPNKYTQPFSAPSEAPPSQIHGCAWQQH